MMLDAQESPALATPYRSNTASSPAWECLPRESHAHWCGVAVPQLLHAVDVNRAFVCRQPKFLALGQARRGQSKLVWKNSRRAL